MGCSLLAVTLAIACQVRDPGPAPLAPEAAPAPSATPEPAPPPPASTPAPAQVLESILETDAPPTLRVLIDAPRFPPGTGPRLAIDQAHHDFHTLDGMFAPFADVARADGFRVTPHAEPFTPESLAAVDVLVIANALAERNDHRTGGSWELPTPSAFTPAEIDALDTWVRAGGRLWLIADHMPFPGAAQALAARLGFR